MITKSCILTNGVNRLEGIFKFDTEEELNAFLKGVYVMTDLTSGEVHAWTENDLKDADAQGSPAISKLIREHLIDD